MTPWQVEVLNILSCTLRKHVEMESTPPGVAYLLLQNKSVAPSLWTNNFWTRFLSNYWLWEHWSILMWFEYDWDLLCIAEGFTANIALPQPRERFMLSNEPHICFPWQIFWLVMVGKAQVSLILMMDLYCSSKSWQWASVNNIIRSSFLHLCFFNCDMSRYPLWKRAVFLKYIPSEEYLKFCCYSVDRPLCFINLSRGIITVIVTPALFLKWQTRESFILTFQ